MALSQNAKYLLKERYCREDENPTQLFDRVSEALSLGDEKLRKQLHFAMRNSYFLPASPTLKSAGVKKTLLHPCHVLPIQDNIESIMECLKNSAIIFHYGGGVGFNISKLRPRGASLSTGGESSGVVSFLELFDKLTSVVKQGAFRRGALMCVLDHNHPEITSFLASKLRGELTNFNISVLVTDDFMKKVSKGEKVSLVFGGKKWNEIDAKNLFDQVCFSAHFCGDPGLLFYDRINKDNSLYPKMKLKATNPCVTGDTLIATPGSGHTQGITIKELADRGEDVPVYCIDEQGNSQIRYGRSPRKTGENVYVYKVILSNGSFVEATGDHKFLLENGETREVLDLTNGDSLMRFEEYGHLSYSGKDLKRTVVDVVPSGYKDVYNITVDDFHNYAIVADHDMKGFRKRMNGIYVHNCGEVPLPPWGSCNLGAINLGKFVTHGGNFNFKKYRDYLVLGIRTLKNVNAVGWYPFPEMSKQMKLLDPCGLGHMGFADALIKLGIDYDSEDTLEFIREIGKPYVEVTDRLAKGSFYKRSQQPTGSLSILGDCSQGIEPVFQRAFQRRLTVGVVEEVRELYKSKHCRTAYEVSPDWHLAVQAEFQKIVDSSVSKTVNLPESATVDDVRNIYLKAWELGCKGITVFRENSKEGVFKAISCDGEECHL